MLYTYVFFIITPTVFILDKNGVISWQKGLYYKEMEYEIADQLENLKDK